MMKTILFTLVLWYLLSQFVAEAIIILAGEPPDEEQSSAIRAGMFMLPALIGLLVVAYGTWHLVRIANFMRVPFVPPVSDNPMEYL